MLTSNEKLCCELGILCVAGYHALIHASVLTLHLLYPHHTVCYHGNTSTGLQWQPIFEPMYSFNGVSKGRAVEHCWLSNVNSLYGGFYECRKWGWNRNNTNLDVTGFWTIFYSFVEGMYQEMMSNSFASIFKFARRDTAKDSYIPTSWLKLTLTCDHQCGCNRLVPSLVACLTVIYSTVPNHNLLQHQVATILTHPLLVCSYGDAIFGPGVWG